MFKLQKWYLTRSLPAFRDSESFTILEQTYKLWQAMEQFETEYNSFVDSFNAEWELFETKYNSDLETFTLAMRQEFQDFIEVIDMKLLNNETQLQSLQSEINSIKTILTSDDVNLDTLQELVNALKNNVGSINDIFTELSKKANKDETIRNINVSKDGETGFALYYNAFKELCKLYDPKNYYKKFIINSEYLGWVQPTFGGNHILYLIKLLDYSQFMFDKTGYGVNPETCTEEDFNNPIITYFQKELTPGEGITIENNVISASGGSGGMKLVATGTYYAETSTISSARYILNNRLKANKLYYIERYDSQMEEYAHCFISTYQRENQVLTKSKAHIFVNDYENDYLIHGIAYYTEGENSNNIYIILDDKDNPDIPGFYQSETDILNVYELPYTL